MATTLLEREIERLNTERVEAEPKATQKSQAQILHDTRIHENYENLFLSATKTEQAPAAQPVTYEEPFAATYASPVQEESYTARRLADYKSVPAAKTGLFEGITYRNGTLIDNAGAAIAVAPAVAPAPTVNASAPAEADEEDALPTRRTLDTLRRTAAAVGTEAQQENGVAFSLSAKAKTVLAVIALFIIAAIAIICVNTSILNSLNAEVTDLSFSADELRMQAQQIEQNILDVTDEENIIEWAISQGMVR